MVAVTPENREIFEEDIKANGSLSEGLLTKLGAMMNWLRANCGDYVGKKEMAALTEAQFAAQKKYSLAVPESQKKWVLMKGQDITGSKFAQLTGITTLPNAVGNGAHAEQVKDGAQILQYFVNQNKAHTHTIENEGGYSGPANGGGYDDVGDWHYNKATSSSGGDVARPNSFTTNFFLMIND